MNDTPRPESPRGIFDSLRALLDTVLGMIHNRFELFTTEIEEETARLVRVLLWAFAAVLSAIVGMTFLGAMILLAAPAEYRALLAAALTLLFLAFAAFGCLAIRRIVRAKPRPFDASLTEMEKDLNRLKDRP